MGALGVGRRCGSDVSRPERSIVWAWDESQILGSFFAFNGILWYFNGSGVDLELRATRSYWTSVDLLRPPYRRRVHCRS